MHIWKSNISARYDALFESAQLASSVYNLVVAPSVLSKIRQYTKPHETVLDIGCGEGYMTRRMQKIGRIPFGFDISQTLIHAAQAKNRTIQYWMQDILKEPQHQKTYNATTTTLVLHSIGNLTKAVRTIRAYTGIRRYSIITVPHPCFYNQETQHWFTTQDKKPLTLHSYLEKKSFMRKIEAQINAPTFHRPISTYIDTFLNGGFSLVELVEPRPKTLHSDLMKKARAIPFVLLFVLQRER